MKIDIIIEHATVETIEKIAPLLEKVEKENLNVLVHIVAKMN